MAAQDVEKIIEERVMKKLHADQKGARAVGKRVAIEVEGDDGGRWVVDCTAEPPTLTCSRAIPADASITVNREVFEGLVSGKISPQSAFMSGKVKIDGDLGAAVRLGSMLI